MFGWTRKRKEHAAPRAPQLPLDLGAQDFVADPYPTYEWLRAHAPVAELVGGGYLLSRHPDIMQAFTNRSLGNAPSRFSTLAPKNADKYVAAELAAHIPPFLDGAAHKPMRQMVSRAFFNSFKGFSPHLEELARLHVAPLRTGDDLIGAGSMPFSLRAMSLFCGLDAKPKELKPLTQAFFHLFAPLRDPAVFAQVNGALADFRGVISNALRAGPPDGSLLAELSAFAQGQGDITQAQIIDNCLLVFADGVENIEAGAATLLARFEAEGCLDDLASGGIDMAAAVREGLRLETPAQLVPRVARESCEIAGTQIKKDMPVFLALASGNRDADVFERADQFEAQRDMAQVLSFGQGKHRCIGEPLAMAQLVAFMTALVQAGVQPAGQTLRYHSRIGHRWPQALFIKRV